MPAQRRMQAVRCSCAGCCCMCQDAGTQAPQTPAPWSCGQLGRRFDREARGGRFAISHLKSADSPSVFFRVTVWDALVRRSATSFAKITVCVAQSIICKLVCVARACGIAAAVTVAVRNTIFIV